MKSTRSFFTVLATAAMLLASASALRADTIAFYYHNGLLSKNSWTLFGPCDSFDSISWMEATTAGNASGTPRPTVSPTFPQNEDNGTWSVIFQWLSGTMVKAVKVHFKIEDGQLYAKLFGNNSMYVEQTAVFPYDFNNESYKTYGFVTADNEGNGYNLQKIKVRIGSGPAGSGFHSHAPLLPKATWAAICPCDSFNSITFPMTASTAGTAAGKSATESTFFRDEGNGTFTAIFQWLDDKYIKAVKVAFKIEDGILYAKLHGDKAMYVSNSNTFPYDFNNGSPSLYNFALAETDKGYNIKGLSLRVGGVEITGEPGEYSIPDPAYGDYTNWTARTVSTLASDNLGGIHTVCTGYRVYYTTNSCETWALASSGTANSTNDFDAVHIDGAVMRTKLIWLYEAGMPPGADAPTLVASDTSALTVAANVSGIGYTASSATVKFAYGLSPNAMNLTNTVSTTAVPFESVQGTLTHLIPGRTYYIKAIVVPNEANPVAGESPITALQTDPLPEFSAAYARLEYIEGDGAQWIDTEYYPTPATRTVANFQHMAVESQSATFLSNDGNLRYGIYINNALGWAYHFNDNGGNAREFYKPADTGRHVFDFNYADDDGRRCLSVDDGAIVSVTDLAGNHTKTATIAMGIGAVRTGEDKLAGLPSKHRIYSFRIYENPSYGNETLVRDYIPAMRLSDSVCGLYDGVEDKFCTSFKTTSSPVYTPFEYAGGPVCKPFTATEVIENGALASVRLDFTAFDSARTLKVAMGAEHGGVDPSGWALTNTVATIAAGETNATWSVPSDWGEGQKFLARFFFDDGATALDWSNTIYWHDLSDPLVDIVSLNGIGGDTVIVTGNLVSFNGADCSLAVYTGDSATTATNLWANLPGSVRDATGSFTLTLCETNTAAARYIAPDSTVFVVVEAVSGGKSARSELLSVTTKAAPVFLMEPSCAINHRTATITATFSDFGECDEATVTLYAGPADAAESDLVAIEGPVVRYGSASGIVTFEHTFDGFNAEYKWQIRAYSVSAGETSTNEVRSAVAALTTVDQTDYYWKGHVASGDWSDPANWRPGSHEDDCMGYPDSTTARALFTYTSSETGIVVNVNGQFTVKDFYPNGTVANDIRFVGTGSDASSLTVTTLLPTYSGNNGWRDTPHDATTGKRFWPRSNTRLEFKDMTLSFGCDWEYIRSGSDVAGNVRNRNDVTNILLRLEGVRMELTGGSKYFAFSTPYSRLYVVDSDLSMGKVAVGGTNTVVTIDNSKWTMSDSFYMPQDSCGDMTLAIKGAAPQLKAANRIATQSQDDNCEIVFSIPVGGYAVAPILLTSGSYKFAEPNSGAQNNRMSFSIDPKSPAARTAGKIEKLLLVNTSKGFDNIRTVDPVGAAPNASGADAIRGEFAWGKNGVTEGFSISTATQLYLLNFKGVGRTVFMVQ